MTLETFQNAENKISVTDQTKNEMEQHAPEKAAGIEGVELKTEDQLSEGIELPELKGLDILKEGTYAIDPEKTIYNMVAVVKKMEVQLHETLRLNSDLEKDFNDSKVLILDLKAEKAELENIILRMEEEIPSKRELQMEIEYLIDERNSTQGKIRDLKHKIIELNKNAEHQNEIISDLKEDKKNYRVESDYLVIKLDSLMKNNRIHLDEIKKLNRENLAKDEKIKALEQELKKADEERFRMYKGKII